MLRATRNAAPVATILALLAGGPALLPAQDLAGSWVGTWIQGTDTLDVAMRFRNAGGVWGGEFDAERLRVQGIPFTEVAVDPPAVRLRMVGDATTMEFQGRVHGDSLSGTLVEDGAHGRFAFVRIASLHVPLREEEVRFRNGDVQLVGTLVLPLWGGPHVAVVFLHGSGPEGRWASRFLAQRLANEGFAALIWDKRGVGGSDGAWETAGFEDQAGDVGAAVAFLRSHPEIDPDRVGLHGHSQGGTIAPLAAVRSQADFVIGSAAAGLPMEDVEVFSIGNAIGVSSLPPDEAALAKGYVDAIVDVAYRGAPREELEAAAARAEGHDWYFEPPGPEDSYWSFSRRIADFDPLYWWGQIRVPVLLVYGAEDERVPAEPSRAAIVNAIGDRVPVETRIFEDADHTFRIRRPGDVWPRTVEGYPDVIIEWLNDTVRRIRAQDDSSSLLDVRVVADEAVAALTILEKHRSGEPVVEADWERLFSTEGFRRLEARERFLERDVDRDVFRSWLLADSTVARVDAYREAIAWWEGLDANKPAERAFSYLPAGTTVRAKLYPTIKPTANSFVFEISTDPAIFIHVDPDEPPSRIENTLAHELHHVGTAGAPDCEPARADSLEAGARTALDWLSGFAEGVAVLAAAGGPDVHPHTGRTNDEYVVWERDVANFASDLESLDLFFLDLVQGRLTDEAEIRRRGFAFITSEGIPQGPFYTVGWKMAAIVEKAEGRETVVGAVCDPRLLLAGYDRVARVNAGPGEPAMPSWSPDLLEALGIR